MAWWMMRRYGIDISSTIYRLPPLQAESGHEVTIDVRVQLGDNLSRTRRIQNSEQGPLTTFLTCYLDEHGNDDDQSYRQYDYNNPNG